MPPWRTSGHSPRQAGGDAEEVHDVAGVAVLAEDHLRDRATGREQRRSGRRVETSASESLSFLSGPNTQAYFKKKTP